MACRRSAIYGQAASLARKVLSARRIDAPAASSWHYSQLQGFNKLETQFLTEEIFEDSCYIKPSLIRLEQGDTVVDVGSNIGIFGLQAAQIVGHTGRVISVEALPPTFKKLQANRDAAIQQGHIRTEWITVNAAAGATNGCLDMTFFPRAAGWGTSEPVQHKQRMRADLSMFIKSLLHDQTSGISQTTVAKFGRWLLNTSDSVFEWVLGIYTWWMSSASKTYTVPMLTLATIFQERNIDTVSLLKVDVEGAEVAVLQGLTPDAWGKVQQVVAEVHSDALLAEVTAILDARFDHVLHEQGERMRGTQLHMVYASQPRSA